MGAEILKFVNVLICTFEREGPAGRSSGSEMRLGAHLVWSGRPSYAAYFPIDKVIHRLFQD
jgi:hypothetical protein